MKKPLVSLLIIILLQACAPGTFYQIYKATPENGTVNNSSIVFENEQCTVSYNLWGKGGNIGFEIFNKTENDLVLNLDKCFFVVNGNAYSYYQNREFSTSESSGTISAYTLRYYNTPLITQGTTSNSQTSTTIIERAELTVPSKTKITIKEFKVSTERYVNCDLPKYPEKTPKVMTFTAANSPFTFYNIVSYTIKGNTKQFENKFYVSEITNQPRSALFIKVTTSPCGRKLEEPKEEFKDPAPAKFYIKYQ